MTSVDNFFPLLACLSRLDTHKKSVFTEPLHYRQDVTQGQFLSGVIAGFEFRVFILLEYLPNQS